MKTLIVILFSICFITCDLTENEEKHYPIHKKTGTYVSWGTIEAPLHDLYLFWSQEPVDTTLTRNTAVDFTFEVHASEKAYNGMRYYGNLLTIKVHQ